MARIVSACFQSARVMFYPTENGVSSAAIEWAESVAPRIRWLQIRSRHDSVEARRELISSEIKRQLQEVDPSHRSQYLSALTQHFPTPEGVEAIENAAARDPVAVARSLVKRLGIISSELDPATKALLSEDLRRAGFLTASGRDVVLEPQLLGRLGLTPQQSVSEQQLAKLCEMLIDFAGGVDEACWEFWSRIAPNSTVRRESLTNHFRHSLGRFLNGEKEPSGAQISRALDKTRHLITGLIAAVGAFAESYAKKHLETYSPEKIRASVAGGTSSILSGTEQKCWKRYVALAKNLNGPAIEHQLNNTIIKQTEAAVSKSSAHRNSGN